MPTYEYACQNCGHHIEVYQRFSDEPLTVCSICGGPLRKVFHPAGILFKGSGFYATDSRRSSSSGEGKKPSEKSGSADTSTSTSSSSSSDAGSDSGSGGSKKPDTKAASPASEKSA